MNEEKHMSIHSDDEDDLELLRLAALKSINSKKDSSPTKNQEKLNEFENIKLHLQIDTEPPGSQEVTFSNISRTISQQQNSLSLQSYGMNSDSNSVHRIDPQGYFSQAKTYQQRPINHMGGYGSQVTPYIPSVQPRLGPIVHPGPTVASNLIRPVGPVRHWIPPEQAPNNGNIIYNVNKVTTTYTPNPIVKDTHTDVQLSPRSLAFVAQNNGILARRKIEADLSPKKHYRRSKSPNYRRISRSPSPAYRSSPGRWSISPPPLSSRPQRFSKSKSKSPPRRSRSKPLYNYKRSRSRSSSGSGHVRNVNERRRRSFSRNSDYRPLSPVHHNRHISRSPLSNKITNIIKRNKSRSPLPRRYSPPPNLPHRRLSRSRSPRRNFFDHRRSRSPQAVKRRSPPPSNMNKRNQKRVLDRKSPFRNKRKSPIGRDIVSRRDSPTKNNFSRRPSRKSLSPQLRKRSKTPRSPANKKFIRKSRDRQVTTTTSISQTQHGSTNIRRRSPIVNTFKIRNQESYNNNNNNNNTNTNNNTNNNSNNNTNNNSNTNSNSLRSKIGSEFRKSRSPFTRTRRSRSKSLDKLLRKDDLKTENEIVNTIDIEKLNQKTFEEQSNKISSTLEKSKEIIEKSPQKLIKGTNNNKNESKTPPPSEENFESLTPPIEKDMDDAKLLEQIDAMLNDDKSNKSNSSDEEDDGIDLFASEESESENEGRFKSTNKTERNANIAAMSFTKLKESSTTSNVRNLQDIVSEEKYDDNQNKSRRDYFKKYGRNNKSNNRRRGDDYISSKRRSRSNSADKNRFSNISENTNNSKFKSTFQIIKNEGSRILSKPSVKSNIRSTPERNVKKRSKDNNSSELKDRKSSVEKIKSSSNLIEQLSNNNNNSQSNCKNGQRYGQKMEKIIRTSAPTKSKLSISKNSSNSRKSIHSRLGAMTNTFKTTSKSSWDMNSYNNDQV